MPLTLRLRHGGGMATLDSVPDDATVAQLRELIATKIGIAARRQFLKVGFPPAPLPDDAEDKRLTDVGCNNRETVVVEEREPPPDPLAAPDADAAAKVAEAAGRLGLPALLPPDGVGDVERHVIPADNSCLFASVAYLLRSESGTPTPPVQLRQLVGGEIARDPERWDPITLAESGKTSLEYADWIQRDDSWGGSLELIVLSEKLGVQLSAVCVRSLRVEHFPHEGPHRHRAYVLYDGIHYDAVVGRAAAGGGEVRVFSPSDDLTLNKVVALGVELQESKQFTDTANFTLQCQHCWKKLKGEADAQEHGKQTGHFNFQEVH